MLRTLGIIRIIRARRSDVEVMRNGLNNDGCEGGGDGGRLKRQRYPFAIKRK